MNLYIAVVSTAALAVSLAVLIHQIKLKGTIIMKDKELLDAINDATNNLAKRIAARDAAIKAAGELTPELEAEGVAIVAALNSLAADPADPVPSEPIA